MDYIGGYSEVCVNERGEVVVDYPDLQNKNGESYIVLSPRQARVLAALLIKKSVEAGLEQSSTETPGQVSRRLVRKLLAGCGDNSCRFGPRERRGIGTNGGCRCADWIEDAIVEARAWYLEYGTDEGKVITLPKLWIVRAIAMLRAARPSQMGGTPDLFAPDIGSSATETGDRWDAWEEAVEQLLREVEGL